MTDTGWHFGRDGVQGGPVPADAVRVMLESGQLRRTDLVWREGMPAWQAAGEVPEFAGAKWPTQPPPLPPRAAGPPPVVGPATAAIPYASPGQFGPPPADPAQTAGMRMLMPVGRSGWAIASGYLGLLSIFPFIGVLFGIAAVVTALAAMRDMKRNPHLHGMGRAIFGIVAGVLFSALWLLAFIGAMSR
jgi:hypothetical protein